MPLFREDLHARPRRVALALIAAALAGAAVYALSTAALLHIDAQGDMTFLWGPGGTLDMMLVVALVSLPVWAFVLTLFGLPLLLLLRRARLCGPASMAAAFGATGFMTNFLLVGAGDAGGLDLLNRLGSPLLGGVAAGLVLRRVARAPRVTDADRIGALEKTFR